MAHYYAGNYREAVAALKRTAALHAGTLSAIEGYDWFFLAMAYWQLGNQEEGRRWYDKASVWMEKNYPEHRDLRRFRAEAAALLQIKNPPMSRKEESPRKKEGSAPPSPP